MIWSLLAFGIGCLVFGFWIGSMWYDRKPDPLDDVWRREEALDAMRDWQ